MKVKLDDDHTVLRTAGCSAPRRRTGKTFAAPSTEAKNRIGVGGKEPLLESSLLGSVTLIEAK